MIGQTPLHFMIHKLRQEDHFDGLGVETSSLKEALHQHQDLSPIFLQMIYNNGLDIHQEEALQDLLEDYQKAYKALNAYRKWRFISQKREKELSEEVRTLALTFLATVKLFKKGLGEPEEIKQVKMWQRAIFA